MPLTASGEFATAVEGREYRISASLTLTLPAGGYSDFTLALRQIQWDVQNTTDLPNDVAVQEGYSLRGGTLVLGGPVDKRDETITPLWLLDPGNPASPMYRKEFKGCALTLQVGVVPDGQGAELLQAFEAVVESFSVSVTAGIVTVQFTDDDWGDLPALPAVITDSPWNAGLTNEYPLDRIVRAATNGAISTWPAQRADCVLAVGFRTSLWPEVGTLLSVFGQPSPTFAPGPYGSGLQSTRSNGGYTVPQYGLSVTITAGRVFVEFFVFGLTATNPLNGVTLTAASDILSFNSVDVGVTTTSLTVSVNNGAILSQAVTIDGGIHYIAFEIVLPTLGNYTATALAYLDGASYAAGGLAADPWDTGAIDTAEIALTNGVYAGLQVTTETSPVPNYPFTPRAIIDPSLNVLQTVPVIDQGTQAWDEIQTIASSENGYAFRDNLGRFRFLNRETIEGQAPWREYSSSLLNDFTATREAAGGYEDVACDVTEWQWNPAMVVFTPGIIWKIKPGESRTFSRPLPNGLTAAKIDATFQNLPDGTASDDGNSWWRWSQDRYGQTEFPRRFITGSVRALTSSEIEFTIENRHPTMAAWSVSPANYLDIPAGDISLWVGGVPAVADAPTTLHYPPWGPGAPSYATTGNPYQQDRDAVQALQAFRLKMLRTPTLLYDSVPIRFDPRLQVPDCVTLHVPVAGGGSEPADVLTWDLSTTLDFAGKAVDQTASFRRKAPPGAWLLGTPGASEIGDGAGIQGTAYAY